VWVEERGGGGVEGMGDSWRGRRSRVNFTHLFFLGVKIRSKNKKGRAERARVSLGLQRGKRKYGACSRN